MIPRIIHYCWFGRTEIPARLMKCIKSWKEYLGDYTFMRWDEDSFDVNLTAWTKEAYDAKKYAFHFFIALRISDRILTSLRNATDLYLIDQ